MLALAGRLDICFQLMKWMTICTVCFMASCTSVQAPSAPTHSVDDAPLRLFALEGVEFAFMHIHVDSQLSESVPVRVRKGEKLGTVAPMPEKLSDRHDKELKESQRLYRESRFQQAAIELEAAYNNEPHNPFILNTYARALYRVDAWREKAFLVYQQLLAISDSQVDQDKKAAVVIDLWFPEAYWKIGTLHLDRREYSNAAFEISRSLVAAGALGMLTGSETNRPLLAQALTYLAEAYFGMGRDSSAHYYAQKTLALDPENEFCQRLLKTSNQQ